MNEGAILRILRCYLETNVLSFSNLCRQAGYPTDLGGYYIRHLINVKYLVKTARGQYKITPYGKQQFLNLERKQGNSATTQSRLCVMAIIKQDNRLITIRRKQQPFIGFVEWPAVMLSPGEGMADGAKRLLDTRLRVAGDPTLIGFFRRIDVYEDTIFDDKLFAIHSYELESNHVVSESSVYGDNLLVSAEELSAIEKPARALHDIYLFSQAPINYQERQYTLSLEDIIPAS